jgi:hypothetical protein
MTIENDTADEEPRLPTNDAFEGITLTEDQLGFDQVMSITDCSVSDVPPVLNGLPLSAPSSTTYFQTSEDTDLWLSTRAVFDGDTNEPTFIPNALAGAFEPGLLRGVRLIPWTTLEKRVGLWPIKLTTDKDGQLNPWARTALQVCEVARKRWVRRINAGGHWDHAVGLQTDKPWWPDDFGHELIYRLAVRPNLADSIEHPMIKRLRGLA